MLNTNKQLKTIAHKKLLALNRFVKAINVDNSQLAHALGVMILAYHDCLNNLLPIEGDAVINNTPAKESLTTDFVELSCDEISFFMNQLYLRVKASVHESVLPFSKEPGILTPENCKQLKKYFLSLKDAKSDLHELEIGNAYQLNSQLKRKIALTHIQASNKDLSNNEIVLFTQLYTPKWVVDAILDNTIGKENAPTDPKIQSMIDPACGAGHFLLPTFELLLKKMIASGLSERKAVEILARENLCGVDIDPDAVWMSTLSLTVRCLRLKNPFTPQFSQIQLLTSESQSDAELLGTLDRSYDKIASHPLSKRYKFVLTNPPYIGRKLLSRRQKQLLKTHYPDENHDISVAFTRRCLELISPDGKLGVITQSSILYLPSSRQFRQTLIDNYYPSIAIEAGIGVFSMQSGEKIDSLILVLESKSQTSAKESLFIDLRKDVEKALVLEDLLKNIDQPGFQNNHRIFRRNIESFVCFPHLQFNYACPASAVKLFEKFPLLEEVTDVRQGLATTDNERFLRYSWDVSPSDLNQVWFPYVKGAGSQRWFSPIFNVVNWENSGQKIKAAVVEAYPYLNGKYHWVVKNEQFYFREGLSFSFINNANFSVRTLPEGCIFDVAASALFPRDVSRHALLAYLNSSFASKMAHLANPTINFQVGDVKRLPWPNFDVAKQHDLESLALECIKTTQELFNEENLALSLLLGQTPSKGDITEVHLDDRFKSHLETISDGRQKISMLENAISTLVLAYIEDGGHLTSAELLELKNWIDIDISQPKPFSTSPMDFAEDWLLSVAIQKLVQERQIVRISPDTNSAQLVFGITQQQNDWLEVALASTVNAWLETRFKECLKVRFFAYPPIIVMADHQSKALLLVSSLLLREISMGKAKASEFPIETQQALEIMLTLCSDDKDWTSKDLQAKVSSLSVKATKRPNSVR